VIVVDASAALQWLLRGDGVEAIERHLLAPGVVANAPHLLDAEIAHVLRRYVAAGEFEASRAEAALIDLVNFPMYRHAHDFLLPRVWALCHNMTAYDAIYVALAEMLDAPLLTRDRRLASAAVKHVRVTVV